MEQLLRALSARILYVALTGAALIVLAFRLRS